MNGICPNCNRQGVALKDIAIKGMLGRRIKCTLCGIGLKVKPKFIPYLLTDFISQIAVIGSIALALTFKSWAVFILGLVMSVCIFIPCFIYGRLLVIKSPFNKEMNHDDHPA